MKPLKIPKEGLLLKIEAIDLSKIRRRLITTKQWSDETVDLAIALYRKFLFLAAIKGRGTGLVPSKMIDEVWHLHILDTPKYAADCQNVLGFFLHHQPTYRDGEEKSPEDAMRFEATRRLFQETFADCNCISCSTTTGKAKCGNPCGADGTEKQMSICGNCEARCSDQKALMQPVDSGFCRQCEGECSDRAAECTVCGNNSDHFRPLSYSRRHRILVGLC